MRHFRTYCSREGQKVGSAEIMMGEETGNWPKAHMIGTILV